MGCFDRVDFTCPDCGKIIEEQSKAGRCIMKVHNMNEVPIVIATDILNTNVYCNRCMGIFTIASPDITPDTCVRMYLKTKQNDDTTT